MESIDALIQTATVGELACRCRFDCDGSHPVGSYLTCPTHRAAARVLWSTAVPTEVGLITG